jgi:hypothetical protein
MYANQDASGWHQEVAGSVVGAPYSLALDLGGFPHIAALGKTILYAFKDGTGWHVDATGPVDAGPASLDLDSQGYPHLVYTDCMQEQVAYLAGHPGGRQDPVVFPAMCGWPRVKLDVQDRAYLSYSGAGAPVSYQISHGLEMAPAEAYLLAEPGTLVTYTLRLDNTGNLADTVDVALAGARWPVTAPAALGPLPWGGSATFEVTVQVPAEAVPRDGDMVMVLASSRGDPGQQVTATLTTQVPYGRGYLPLVSRGQKE